MIKCLLVCCFVCRCVQLIFGNDSPDSGIVWYSPGAPQAPIAPPNIPLPSSTSISTSNKAAITGAPNSTTIGSTNNSTILKSSATPASYLNGILGFISPNTKQNQPQKVSNANPVPKEYREKICNVYSQINIDSLCSSGESDINCQLIGSSLNNNEFTAHCARMGLCSLSNKSDSTNNQRFFVWKVPKGRTCHQIRISYRPPRRGKKSGPDFIPI